MLQRSRDQPEAVAELAQDAEGNVTLRSRTVSQYLVTFVGHIRNQNISVTYWRRQCARGSPGSPQKFTLGRTTPQYLGLPIVTCNLLLKCKTLTEYLCT